MPRTENIPQLLKTTSTNKNYLKNTYIDISFSTNVCKYQGPLNIEVSSQMQDRSEPFSNRLALPLFALARNHAYLNRMQQPRLPCEYIPRLRAPAVSVWNLSGDSSVAENEDRRPRSMLAPERLNWQAALAALADPGSIVSSKVLPLLECRTAPRQSS